MQTGHQLLLNDPCPVVTYALLASIPTSAPPNPLPHMINVRAADSMWVPYLPPPQYSQGRGEILRCFQNIYEEGIKKFPTSSTG